MEVLLKRIKRSSFDEVKQDVINNYLANKVIDIDDDVLEKNSEEILINGKQIELCYSLEKYIEIVSSQDPKHIKNAQVGMLLHKETKATDLAIPKNVLYEKEVWAYLSLKVFKEIVYKLSFDDDKVNEDKISRYYFNVASRTKIDRTCLLHLWSLIDLLDSEDNEEMSLVAFHFIDPVRGILERTISYNPIVLKAYVQAIINNKCDPRIKNNQFRSAIPNNISCFSRVNILDAYGYDELVKELTQQIKDTLKTL